MATTEHIIHSLLVMDQFVERMAAASRPDGVLEAVGGYLAGWSKERIHNLQKIDAGWAPFDDRQQPAPVYRIADLVRISDSVRKQCNALKESGIVPPPEMLELDLFFFLARQILENHDPDASSGPAAVLHSRPGGRRPPFGSAYSGSPY